MKILAIVGSTGMGKTPLAILFASYLKRKGKSTFILDQGDSFVEGKEIVDIVDTFNEIIEQKKEAKEVDIIIVVLQLSAQIKSMLSICDTIFVLMDVDQTSQFKDIYMSYFKNIKKNKLKLWTKLSSLHQRSNNGLYTYLENEAETERGVDVMKKTLDKMYRQTKRFCFFDFMKINNVFQQ